MSNKHLPCKSCIVFPICLSKYKNTPYIMLHLTIVCDCCPLLMNYIFDKMITSHVFCQRNEEADNFFENSGKCNDEK